MNAKRQQETLTVPLALTAASNGSGGAKRCTVASCSADAKRHGDAMRRDSFDRYAIMLSVGIIPGSSWSSGPGRCDHQDQAAVGKRPQVGAAWLDMLQHASTYLCHSVTVIFCRNVVRAWFCMFQHTFAWFCHSVMRFSMLQHTSAWFCHSVMWFRMHQHMSTYLCHSVIMQQACNMSWRMQTACNMLREASDRMSVYRSNLSGGGRSTGGVA